MSNIDNKEINNGFPSPNEILSIPTRFQSNIPEDFGDTMSTSSFELDHSFTYRNSNKSINTLKRGNTGKLNEKYAMMQQKMSQMVQDIKSPVANPFLIPSPHYIREENKNISKWSLSNKRRELDLDDESKKSYSFLRNERNESITPNNYIHKFEPKCTPNSPPPYSLPLILRKHAKRFTNIWPPRDDLSLSEAEEYEEKMNELFGSEPTTPSPIVIKNHSSLETILDNVSDDDEEEDLITNIYTRQLTQKNLSFDDAANPPLVTTDFLLNEFFEDNDIFNED
ncbi:1429_t:CDS:2 [Diversispora eburnea]|uniref:1429_t:CDS:1 n=1 Tax=Diversispora eburnea TaxID=1213867 RepID=A0A9N8Z5Y8_9GLOM|nr:1429_t:CDS:2 [Diversispora eburnea]